MLTPMDFCKVPGRNSERNSKRILNPNIKVRSSLCKNTFNVNKTMTEVDVISGFSMDESTSNNEPSITIENNSERPIISLTNDIDEIDDGSLNIIMNGNSLPKPVPVPVRGTTKYTKPEIVKLSTTKTLNNSYSKPKREDSFNSGDSSGDSNSSYLEYKREDKGTPSVRAVLPQRGSRNKPSVPFDFGDIADPVKHKATEEVKYDDNGYSSAGDSSGSDSGSYYSRNKSSSNNHSSSRDHGSSRDHESSRESESDKFRREEEEKQSYLIKLQGLESKGVRLTKEFSMKSHLDDIKFEYESQKNSIDKNASVDFMKNLLITVVHGTEILNNKWDPVGAKLNGWSESVMENLGSYEAIFERLHEKYQGTVDIAPELELLMTLASSAFMFHMMQTLFKNAGPNLGNAIFQDPNLVAGLGKAVGRAADMTNNQQQGIPAPSNMSGPSGGFDISSLLSGLGPMMGMMGGGGGGGLASMMGNSNNVSQAFQNPPPRPVDPRRNEPTMTSMNQQNFNRPKDDDQNSRLTDFSDNESVGSDNSVIRVSKNKSNRRTIHF